MRMGQGFAGAACFVLMNTLRWAPPLFAASPSSTSCRLDLEAAADGGVAIRGADLCDRRSEIEAWIRTAARAVTAYYGRFPTHHLQLDLRFEAGREIGPGTTRAEGGVVRIDIALGRATERGALEDDWVLTHEMIHTALPDLPDAHHWLAEGIATYVEPVARARAGLVSPEVVFAEWMSEMPKGLPEKGDLGLDHTATWARTYWGGALFCLLADVEIREASGNRFGLEHALRAIHDKEGGLERRAEIEPLLATGDLALGGTVLRDLYARFGSRPEAPDLRELWRRLGLAQDGGRLRVDDEASGAAVRRAIVSPPTPRP